MVSVMINGLPGKMATELLLAIIYSPPLEIYPFSLTAEETEQTIGADLGRTPLRLIKPSERSSYSLNPDISVDFTHSTAVNCNSDFYCNHGLSFVMGTTGGNREALEQRVRDSDVCAVIAPNMAKQIVVFQAMMKYAAENFPNVFKRHTLEIVESHQQEKADISGTAKVIMGYFNQLGIPFTQDQIKMIRDPEEQKRIGVPKHYLMGHGWHTYTLKGEIEKTILGSSVISRNPNVLLSFTHNINGRNSYLEGTLDAIEFLYKKVQAGEKGKVYSMIDVLKEGTS